MRIYKKYHQHYKIEISVPFTQALDESLKILMISQS